MRLDLVLVAVALAVAACGGSGGSSGPSSGGSGPAVWDESAIVEQLDLHPTGDGTGWTTTVAGGAECEVAAVMVDANTLDFYVAAGDTVATNPDRTAGVKIVSGERATCLRELNKRLAELRP